MLGCLGHWHSGRNWVCLYKTPRSMSPSRAPPGPATELALFRTIGPSLSRHPPDAPSCPSLALSGRIGPHDPRSQAPPRLTKLALFDAHDKSRRVESRPAFLGRYRGLVPSKPTFVGRLLFRTTARPCRKLGSFLQLATDYRLPATAFWRLHVSSFRLQIIIHRS
jgi:hypothetical protein